MTSVCNPAVKQIVEDWLREHCYDGLCLPGCGCSLDDFMPCHECSENCVAAYRVDCSQCILHGTDKCLQESWPADHCMVAHCIMEEKG